MDEFVIEKCIEINKGISIIYADPDPRFYSVTIQYNTIEAMGSTFVYS